MAPRLSVFVKVSGDEFKNPNFRQWVKELDKRAYVTVCVGGGTQINEALKRFGIDEHKPHGPLGRKLDTFEQRQLARDVLELNQRDLEDTLAAEDFVHVEVVIPVFYIGGVLCHINGDLMVKNTYNGYDEIYVVTTPERLEKKKEDFEGFPDIQVISFPTPS